jgi:hypothetical protein
LSQDFEARIREARIDRALARFMDALRTIVSEERDEDVAIIESTERPSIYIQFIAEKADSSIMGEAVSNAYLDAPDRLSPKQMERLESNGWEAPPGVGNYCRTWTIEDEHDLRLVALEAARTLSDIYGVSALDEVQIRVFE